ncbi:choice-of-anchor D domain-containing protein [Myxococcota bacterium]|nr:choice-of-anchor D domain-containing protein [Myxococcota bacterium]
MRWPWVLFAACLSCGRTDPWAPPPGSPWIPAPKCEVTLDPTALDLGAVAPFERTSATLELANTGTATCTVDGFSVRGDRGFVLGSPGLTLTIAPERTERVEVAFFADESAPPYDRFGELGLSARASGSARARGLTVGLEVHLLHCELRVVTELVDFGTVTPPERAERDVVVENVGDLACGLGGARVEGDAGFDVVSSPRTVPPGGRAVIRVRFTAEPTLPVERAATLVVVDERGDVAAEVPLVAEVALCLLTATPSPLDFGNVPLNTTADRTLTVRNVGRARCAVSRVRLGPDTDPLFSLPVATATILIAPGSAAPLRVTFDARDSAPPHLRTGTLLFDTSDVIEPRRSVPLLAFINTICDERGQFIYTVDTAGTFARFDPVSVTSTPLGQLQCPVPSGVTPFSMNVDQSANAWVLFTDGSLFQVDTANAACRATSYVPGQLGMTLFGMGSAFESATGVDTLYVAGTPASPSEQATLATLDLRSFVLRAVGPMDVGSVELAGTGDGQLWAFAPPPLPGDTALLDLVDPRTGRTIEHYELGGITSPGGSFAVKFWGGAFYLFVGPDVWRLPRDALVPGELEPTEAPSLVFSAPGTNVVGAGVSTCAPVGP